MAYETRNVGLQEWVYVRWNGELIKTTIGRIIFNMAFPGALELIAFVNKIIDKGALKKTITDCYRKYGNAETARFLDAIKDLGFHFATLSGTTVSISDIIVPTEKYDDRRQGPERGRRTPSPLRPRLHLRRRTVQQNDRDLVEAPRKRLRARCRRRRTRSIRSS